jgi:DNA-binding NtrC family response regulator
MANILVVDDDTNILEVIRTRLEANDYYVEVESDPLDALECVREKEFDVIVSDIRMPQIDGMEFLRRVQRLRWDVPVIMLTAYGTIQSAVDAMKQGAFHYLTKPFEGKQLLVDIENALAERGRRQEPGAGKIGKYFPGVYGISPKMKALYPLLERIIESDSTVLIQGESGTGKELVAQMIHYNGKRRDQRFVVMDCGATPGSLIESELFGHTKGSFTNATETRMGLFEMAHEGTLFLDEISSLPLDLQTRLLRVLQSGQIKRVGDSVMKKVDVRVVGATNLDLKEQVQKGEFRLDLYYRLAVLKIDLPPLRERKEDIPPLADYFLQTFARKMRRDPLEWGEGVMDALMESDWLGNVRELKNIIEAAVVLSKGGALTMEDLEWAGFSQQDSQQGFLPGLSGLKPTELSLPEYLEHQERALILTALKENNWVQKDAAEQLGISPRVLCYKIKKLKIEASNNA